MPRGSNTSDPTAEAAVQIQILIERYKEKAGEVCLAIQDALEFKSKMDELIDALPDIQQQVLDNRYRKEMSWTATAMGVHASESQAKRYENDAVSTLQKMIQNEPK